MAKDGAFSYPPRGMSRDVAARYIGVGSTKFDELVTDGRMPKPKRVDGRVIWDRWLLDAAFTELGEEKIAAAIDAEHAERSLVALRAATADLKAKFRRGSKKTGRHL